MRKYLFLLFALASCREATIEDQTDIAKEISYFKDEDTGPCFAQMQSMSYLGYYVNSIACVPCDSLKNLIK